MTKQTIVTNLLDTNGRNRGNIAVTVDLDINAKTKAEQVVIDAAKDLHRKWSAALMTLQSPAAVVGANRGPLLDAVMQLNNLTEATGSNPTESTSVADGMSGTARLSGASVSDAESSNASIPSASSKFKVGDKVSAKNIFNQDFFRIIKSVDGDRVRVQDGDGYDFGGFFYSQDVYTFVEDANGFKIGDRVKIKSNGRTGTIRQRLFNIWDWSVELDEPHISFYSTKYATNTTVDNLEHYVEPRFKVGDRVKIKHGGFTGSVGTIELIRSIQPGYTVQIPSKDAMYFGEDELEPYDGLMPGDRVRYKPTQPSRAARLFKALGVVEDGIYVVDEAKDKRAITLVGIKSETGTEFTWGAYRFELVKP